MADIFFKCPECDGQLVVDQRGAGMRLPCPYCTQSVIIPSEFTENERPNSSIVNSGGPEWSNPETAVSSPAPANPQPDPALRHPSQSHTKEPDDPMMDLDWGSDDLDDSPRDEEIRRLAAMMNPEETVLVSSDGRGRTTTFRCPSCGEVWSDKRAHGGDRVKCSACQSEFKVPILRRPGEQNEPARKPVRSTKGVLPSGRNPSLRTADDIRKAPKARERERHLPPAASNPGNPNISPRVQELVSGVPPASGFVQPRRQGAPPPGASSSPVRRKPPPPLAEHAEVIPAGGTGGGEAVPPVSSNPRPAGQKRETRTRPAQDALPPLVTMDSIDLDSEVARQWGEQAVVPTKTLNWLAWIIILAVLLAGGYFGYEQFAQWMARKEAADSFVPDPEPLAAARAAEEAQNKAIMAALKKFHVAYTAEEKSQFVRNPEVMLPLMQEYYGNSHNIEPRVIIEDSITIERGSIGKSWFQIKGQYKDYSLPLHAHMIETADGDYLLDWKSWVGYNEVPLKTFIGERPSTSHVFRLQVWDAWALYGSPYNEAEYRSFRLKDKNETEQQLSGYVKKDTELSRRLIDLFRDLKEQNKNSARLMLAVRFEPESNPESAQVLIEALVSESWVEVPESPSAMKMEAGR